MVTCAVPGCNSTKKENLQNYTFHIFPQNMAVRQKWLRMLNREDWVPKKYSTVCSLHFEQKCFSHNGTQRVKLCSGSVPTLFMPILLKPTRKVSTYIYRDISPVPSTSTANATIPDKIQRMNKMMKIIDTLRRRLAIKRKQLKNIRAQKMRADKNVVKLTNEIKKLKNLPSHQNNVGPVMGSCSNSLLQHLIERKNFFIALGLQLHKKKI